MVENPTEVRVPPVKPIPGSSPDPLGGYAIVNGAPGRMSDSSTWPMRGKISVQLGARRRIPSGWHPARRFSGVAAGPRTSSLFIGVVNICLATSKNASDPRTRWKLLRPEERVAELHV